MFEAQEGVQLSQDDKVVIQSWIKDQIDMYNSDRNSSEQKLEYAGRLEAGKYYNKNDVVLTGEWTMVANKNTNQNATPTQEPDNSWTMPTDWDPLAYSEGGQYGVGAYLLDGTLPVTANFAGGGFRLTYIADGIALTDGATVNQLLNAIGTLNHSDLKNITPNDHHAKAHLHDGLDGSGVIPHANTSGRDAVDAHPTSAITGLDAKQLAQDQAHTAHTDDTDNPHNTTYANLGGSQPSPVPHQHVESDVTNLDKYTQAEINAQQLVQDQAHTAHVNDTDNPHNTTYQNIGGTQPAPVPHTHVEADITDLDKYTQAEIDAQQLVQDQALDTHKDDVSNPHAVTHAQVTGKTPNDHHNQVHKFYGTDHSDIDDASVPLLTDIVDFTGTVWSTSRRTRSVGDYVEGTTYYKGDEVSNTSDISECLVDGTTSAPFVAPVGAERFVYLGTGMANIAQLASQIYFGNRYSNTSPFYITGYRINVVAGNQYRVVSVKNPDTAPVFREEVNFIASTTGWVEFRIDAVVVPANETFDLLALVAEPDPTPIEVLAHYNYQTPQNTGIPTTGSILHARGTPDVMRINYIDFDAVDRTVTLQGLDIGDNISDGLVTWAVQANSDEGTYAQLVVAPANISAEDVKEFSFETVAPTPISVPTDPLWWPTSDLPNTKGLIGVDTNYEGLIVNDNAYGVDIIGQEAYLPDPAEWRLKIIAGSTGSSDKEFVPSTFAGPGTTGYVPDPITSVNNMLRDDGTWAPPPVSPVGGVGLRYTWEADITPPPLSGEIRVNNADQMLATELYAHANTRLGNDALLLWITLQQGDYIGLWEEGNQGHESIYYSITGPVVDNITYVTVPVVWIAGVGGIDDKKNTTAFFIQSPGNKLPLGGTTDQVLAKVSDDDFDTEWQDPAGTTTVDAGTTTTGAAGTNADVQNSGDTKNAIFDFTIPRGDDGADGAIGPEGPEGPEGPQGLTGPKGDTGDQGLPGNDGAQGLPGNDGADGLDGAPGPEGPSAVSDDLGNIASLGSDSLIYVPNTNQTMTSDTIIAIEGQTVVNTTQPYSLMMMVVVNGFLLAPGDYGLTNPTTITLTSALKLDDIVVLSYTEDLALAPIVGVVPIGTITMYNGSIAAIPDNWAICDGTNGTPNMIDMFVMGTATEAEFDATGGYADTVVVTHSHTQPTHTHTGPSHTHTGGAHTHTGPNHRHTGPSHTHTANHNHSASSGSDSHTHTYARPTFPAGAGIGYGTNYSAGTTTYSTGSDSHNHSITVNTTTMNTGSGGTGNTGYQGTGATGSAGATTTTAAGTGATGSAGGEDTGSAGISGVGRNLPPYIKLAYIRRMT